MHLHREGYDTLLLAVAIACFGLFAAWTWAPSWLAWSVTVVLMAIMALLLWFFRVPHRTINADPHAILAPADGKVVAIEQVDEPEYLKDRRIQVSIFMSPLNVHVNWFPISGTTTYEQYHPGKYLVAWHPKSSTENERSTVVVRGAKCEVLIRQIAGAMARRIRTFAVTGMAAQQGGQLGFIKFGSRVDLFLPLNASIKVSLGQHVRGIDTVIATLPEPAP